MISVRLGSLLRHDGLFWKHDRDFTLEYRINGEWLVSGGVLKFLKISKQGRGARIIYGGVRIISKSAPILENTQFKIQNSIQFRFQEIDKKGEGLN